MTDPTGLEAGWDFTLTKPDNTTTTLTTVAGGASNTVNLTQEGTYTITEVAKPGWEPSPWKSSRAARSSSRCTFTVDLPGDAGKLFGCTFFNKQLRQDCHRQGDAAGW